MKKNKQKNVYLLGPVDCDYDEYDSFVVISSSPEKARKLILKEAPRQPAFQTCDVKKVGNSLLKEQVLLGSFNAG